MAQNDKPNRIDCGLRDPCKIIENVVKLMECPITKEDTKRHLKLLNEFHNHPYRAIYVRTLPSTIRLFEILSENLTNVPEYEIIIEKLLNLCFHPPIAIKALEKLTFQRDVQEFYSVLGYMLLRLPNYRSQILCAITSALSRKKYCPLGISKECCVNALEQSLFPDILGNLLESIDDETYGVSLEAVKLLISLSDKFCEKIMNLNVLTVIMVRLESTWESRYPNKAPKMPEPPLSPLSQHYEITSDILWLMLTFMEQHPKKVENVQCPTQFAMWSIGYVLRWMIKSSRAIDRNNVMALILNILRNFPTMNFTDSAIATDIALLIQAANGARINEFWVHNINFKSCQHDFEFVQTLLLCLPYYIYNYSSLRILETSMIINNLFKLLRGKQKTPWDKVYHKRLRILVLEILLKIVPHLLEDFLENNGAKILLEVLNNYVDSMDMIIMCLQTIQHLTKRVIDINKSVVWNDGIGFITDLCENILAQDKLKQIDHLCLGYAFCILEIFCKISELPDTHYFINELFLKYMRRILEKNSMESLPSSKVLVCFMHTLWTWINSKQQKIFCPENFIANGGVYLMLDIIEKNPLSVKLVTLGVLIDLCSYSSCIPYLITWRNCDRNINTMLLDIFRLENEAIGVKVGQYGEILDADGPIMGQRQKEQLLRGCIGNFAIADFFGSCRPKIYALLEIINGDYEDRVKIANEAYRLYNIDNLNLKDQIILLVAGNYLELKLGEAWEEVKMELDKLEMIPICIDREILLYLTNRRFRWSQHLESTQQDIIRAIHDKDLAEEKKYYCDLMEARMSSAMNALRDMKLMARCSEKMFRKSKKLIQELDIEKSVLTNFGQRPLNRTYFTQFNISFTVNQTIALESDVKKAVEKISFTSLSTISDRSMDLCSVDHVCLPHLEEEIRRL